MPDRGYRPSSKDPLLILAMDHRASFGRSLFNVQDDQPDAAQVAAMEAAKRLIYAGLARARGRLPGGRAGVLVDERYGLDVAEAARRDGVLLAMPVERSGRDWFELEWGDDWLEHVTARRPDFAKVLVRDNPAFPPGRREQQLRELSVVSGALRELGVPLLYELLVPATDGQLAAAGGAAGAYDREVRPGLVIQVIADNQAAGVEPAIWKVEGLETVDAARQVARQAKAGGRDADLIVLGRDAPVDRLDHWLEVASEVSEFVGFAIGRSIWEDAVRDYEASDHSQTAARHAAATVTERYLGFVAHWST